MVWVIVVVVGIIGLILVLLKDLILTILNHIFYFIRTLFGGNSKFNIFVLKLIGSAVVIAIGCGVLLRLYGWEYLETAIQVCITFIVIAVVIMPVINTFSSVRSVDDYSLRIIGCATTIALGGATLFWLYRWEFVKIVIQGCVVTIVCLAVVMLIRRIFSST